MEVALSLLLLVGAGLLIRSFVALRTVDLGFNPENVLVARIPLPRGQYATAAEKHRFFGTVLDRLHALPGVVVATETTTLPPYGGIGTDIEIGGKTHTEKWRAIFQLCSEGYFQTLGLRLSTGRTFSAAEVNGARKVAVVNQTLVTRYFGTEDPIGQRIKLSMLEDVPRRARRRSRLRNHRRHLGCEEPGDRGARDARGVRALHDHRRLRARHPRADARRS